MATTTTNGGRRKLVPPATANDSAPLRRDDDDDGPIAAEPTTVASLARDLAEIIPPGGGDDEPIPDGNYESMLEAQEPTRPEEIVTRPVAREATATHATIARELSPFKRMIGDSSRIEIFFENDIGQQELVSSYGPNDIEPYGTVRNFILRKIAPKYGGGGTFPVRGTSANGKQYNLEVVRITKPVEDPQERGHMDMTRDLLARQEKLQDLLIERASARVEQPDIFSQMERMEELKRKNGGDSNSMMMMMLMQQQQAAAANRGPDPSVLALSGIVKDIANELKELKMQATAPPPPMGNPGPSATELLLIEMVKSMRPAESPTDTFLKMAALLKPAPAPDPLETLVRLKELGKSSDNSPFKERMEEMMLMKKMMGGDNPFGDILKSFMGSPLGAGLGSGLGDAVRNRSLPAPQQKPQQPQPQPQQQAPGPQAPDLPPGYLETFQARINDATDDGARVAAVVDSLLALAGDPRWTKFAAGFMAATVADDLVEVNQFLKALFNVWAEKGATIDRAKLDEAIRAVNISWNIIVPQVCAMAQKPLPESFIKRNAAAVVQAADLPASAPSAAPPSPPAPPPAAPPAAAPPPAQPVESAP